MNMPPKRILVLGGGFAGLWAAVGAARKLDELHIGPDAAEVTRVNADPFHGIRVRNYESDLTAIRRSTLANPSGLICLIRPESLCAFQA
jgi:NADH dehydrogenase